MLFFFFFLMIRLPPRSTLFPYTTLPILVNNFNCRGFGPLLEDKLCLIFKLAPSVCRMTFPILASLLVRLNIRRSEERFSRNAETELVCRLLLEKKNAPPPPSPRDRCPASLLKPCSGSASASLFAVLP